MMQVGGVGRGPSIVALAHAENPGRLHHEPLLGHHALRRRLGRRGAISRGVQGARHGSVLRALWKRREGWNMEKGGGGVARQACEPRPRVGADLPCDGGGAASNVPSAAASRPMSSRRGHRFPASFHLKILGRLLCSSYLGERCGCRYLLPVATSRRDAPDCLAAAGCSRLAARMGMGKRPACQK